MKLLYMTIFNGFILSIVLIKAFGVCFDPFACYKFHKTKFKIICLNIPLCIHIYVYKNEVDGNFIHHH